MECSSQTDLAAAVGGEGSNVGGNACCQVNNGILACKLVYLLVDCDKLVRPLEVLLCLLVGNGNGIVAGVCKTCALGEESNALRVSCALAYYPAVKGSCLIRVAALGRGNRCKSQIFNGDLGVPCVGIGLNCPCADDVEQLLALAHELRLL